MWRHLRLASERPEEQGECSRPKLVFWMRAALQSPSEEVGWVRVSIPWVLLLLTTPAHPDWQNQIGGQRIRETVEAALDFNLGAQKMVGNDGELEGQMDDGKLKPREGAHLPKVTQPVGLRARPCL